MKVLLDSCIWRGTVDPLKHFGHDVIWTGDWSKDPGDDEILKYAIKEKRALITLDKDFGELAVVQGIRHYGIIRLVGFRAKEQAKISNAVLEKYSKELLQGSLISVTPQRIRVRSKFED